MSPAPIWRRMAAGVYDLFAVLGLLFISSALITWIVAGIDISKAHDPDYLRHQIWYVGLLLMVWFSYYYYSWIKAGQTIGMKAWNIKLVDDGHHYLGLRLTLRFVAGLLGLSLLTGYFNQQKNCIHDWLSKTRVVYLQ